MYMLYWKGKLDVWSSLSVLITKHKSRSNLNIESFIIWPSRVDRLIVYSALSLKWTFACCACRDFLFFSNKLYYARIKNEAPKWDAVGVCVTSGLELELESGGVILRRTDMEHVRWALKLDVVYIFHILLYHSFSIHLGLGSHLYYTTLDFFCAVGWGCYWITWRNETI